jgi:Lipopolysaccharide export system permease LptF/LptG
VGDVGAAESMMLGIPLYQRWMARRWLTSCFSVTVAMLMLFSFFDALNQWDSSHSTVWGIVRWVIKRAPFNLYELLPFSVLLSSMVTASNWVKYSEWVLIRFAGWSWKHTLIGLLLGGLFWGGVGLLADTVNARWMEGMSVSRQSTWIQSGGYILKVGHIRLTGAESAELSSTYIYPDSASVGRGKSPDVDLIPLATLQDNRLLLDASFQPRLPASITLPFYFILEQQTLERLDLFFLLRTMSSLKWSHVAATPTEAILRFTLIKKIAYPLWMVYWMAWGSLLFLVPPRFKYVRLYQSVLFSWGAIWMFMYRTLSTVLMQKGLSGIAMNLGFMALGLVMMLVLRRVLIRKVGAG